MFMCKVPGAGSSDRPNAEMTFLLTSSWFFRGSNADMLAALTGGACFIVESTASFTHSVRKTSERDSFSTACLHLSKFTRFNFKEKVHPKNFTSVILIRFQTHMMNLFEYIQVRHIKKIKLSPL